MKLWAKRLGWVLLAIFIGMQLIPIDGRSPVVDAKKALHPPTEVEAILRASCYDCHSDETRWPWYTYVAPVSWWLMSHVHEGRENMNFSRWGDLTSDKQADMLGDIANQIATGDMPLPSYLVVHPAARLTVAQVKILTDWTDTAMKQIEAQPATKPAKSPAQP
jgi:hypothetical protein